MDLLILLLIVGAATLAVSLWKSEDEPAGRSPDEGIHRHGRRTVIHRRHGRP